MRGPRKNLTALDKMMMNKASMQGGVMNFLGKQPEVTAPIRAQSHADSPPVELAYITDAEKDLLVKANIHGSMAGKPNPGPAGIASLDDFFTTTDDKGNVQIGGGGGEQVFSYEQGDTQGAGGYTPQTGVGSGQGVTDEGKIVESKKPTLPEEKKKEEKKEETVFQKIQDIFTGDEINNFTPLMLNKVQEQLNQFQKLGVKNPLTLRSLLFGNIGGGIFGKDQTFTDEKGNVIDPETVVEGPLGMKGLNEDGELVDVRLSREGFINRFEDKFGDDIFQRLEKFAPDVLFGSDLATMPATSGGLLNLADNPVATKNPDGSYTTADGRKITKEQGEKYNNAVFAARAELDRMGKNPFTGTTQDATGQMVASKPILPIPGPMPGPGPVPRPGPIEPPVLPTPTPFPGTGIISAVTDPRFVGPSFPGVTTAKNYFNQGIADPRFQRFFQIANQFPTST